MSYTPQQGLFVNGRIADGNEVLNEFNAISVAIKAVDDKVVQVGLEATQASDTNTDNKLAALKIDGGSF